MLLRLASPTHAPRMPAFVGACIMSGGIVRRTPDVQYLLLFAALVHRLRLVQLEPVAESSERRRMGAAVYLA